MQRAATSFRAYILEIQPRRIKYQIALDGAQSRGKIHRTGGCIFDVNTARDAWAIQRAFNGRIDLRWTARIKARHKSADEPQIQSTVEA